MSGYSIGSSGGATALGIAGMWNGLAVPETGQPEDDPLTGTSIPSGVTEWDQGTVLTPSYTNRGIVATNTSVASYEMAGWYLAAPSLSRYRVSLYTAQQGKDNGAGAFSCGPLVAENAAPTTGDLVTFVRTQLFGRDFWEFLLHTGYTNASAADANAQPAADVGGVFPGIVVDTVANTMRGCWSPDGLAWSWIGSAVSYATANFSADPQSIGWVCTAGNNQQTNGSTAMFRGFRVQEVGANTDSGLLPRGGYLDGTQITFDGTTQAVW